MSFVDTVLSFFGGKGIPQGCTFTLSCAGEKVVMPVTPESFKASNTYKNSTLDINAIGEINMIGNRGLEVISFDGFFPAQKYEWSDTNDTMPYNLVRKVKRFAISKKPCKIVISNTAIAMHCTIESFNYDEHDGTSDVYYSISLKEYRYVRPTSEVKNDTTGLYSRIAEVQEEKEMVAYKGNHLLDTANKMVSKVMPIAEQGQKAIKAYKAMVKSGVNPINTTIKVSKKNAIIKGKVIPL